jgi:hypothetical protein
MHDAAHGSQFPPTADLRGVICWYDETNHSNRVADVTDGMSNSIMLGECGGASSSAACRTNGTCASTRVGPTT